MMVIILLMVIAKIILFLQLVQLQIAFGAELTLINVSNVCMDICYLIKHVYALFRTVCNASVVLIAPNVHLLQLPPFMEANLNVYLQLCLQLFAQFQIA